MNVDVRTFSGISERAVSVRSTNMAKTTAKLSLNFIRALIGPQRLRNG